MSTMTQDIAAQIPAALALLVIISVVGSLGNSLVLIIYSQKREKSTANQFIRYLAISDTFVCVFLIPYTIYIEAKDWNLPLDVICKLYYFVNNTSIPFGAILITLIAVDRYLCICHPFRSLMTIRRSKICVFSFFAVSLLLGTVSTFQVRLYAKNKTTINNESVWECIDVSRYKKPTAYEMMFFSIVQRSQTVSYAVCILTVLCLYSLIYRAIIRASIKKARLKAGLGRSSYRGDGRSSCYYFLLGCCLHCPRPPCRSSSTDSVHTAQDDDRTGVTVALGDQSSLMSPKCTKKPSIIPSAAPLNNNCGGKTSKNTVTTELNIKRKFKETILFQNFKTALMLLVVTITYILTFLPACLMINKVIELNLPVFYMYYMNNAANPIIYGFMNKNFRDDVKSFFRTTFLRR